MSNTKRPTSFEVVPAAEVRAGDTVRLRDGAFVEVQSINRGQAALVLNFRPDPKRLKDFAGYLCSAPIWRVV